MGSYTSRGHLLRSLWLTPLIALTLLAVACGGPNAPSAQQLISNAQKALQKVKSYHFTLKADNPGQGSTLAIQSADGDVLVPDKLAANAAALVFGQAVQVKYIAIGNQQYLTDPITGRWQKSSGLIDPRALSDPNTGIGAILGHIQNPSAPTDSSVNNTSCWSTGGKLDAKYLQGIVGSQAKAGSLVDATTCIGKDDNLPYLIRLTGIATEGDSAKTVRTFTFSKYNENITINAPTV